MSGKKVSDQSKTESTKQKGLVFQVGDLAVYPAHGVGKIEAIECRVINGEKHDFYIMKVLENNMLIMIPIFIISLTIREYFIGGLTMGAVK